MSEATLRHFLGAGDGIPVVASVGTSVAGEVPATKHAVSVLAKRGIGLSEHRSRHLERDDLVSADLIIVMTRQHELAVGLLDPEARSRTFLLGELVRLAGQVGQRLSGQSLREWVWKINNARGGYMITGRLADEIADPYGETVEVYERLAVRLDGYCGILARLVQCQV